MPYSETIFDKQVEEFLVKHPMSEYLDIGPGAGKYGQMIRKLNPKAKIMAIEAHLPYVNKYKLKSVYDRVVTAEVENYFDNQPDFTTEVVIMGDVIEHLKKSDGVDLVHFLVYRAKYLIIIFPSKYVQYAYEGVEHEAHRSVWGKGDFDWVEHDYKAVGYMNMVTIKGYLSDS